LRGDQGKLQALVTVGALRPPGTVGVARAAGCGPCGGPGPVTLGPQVARACWLLRWVMAVAGQAAYWWCRIGSGRCGVAAAGGVAGDAGGTVAEAGLSFAGLLRQLRAEARLTQEEVAEAASLSPRSVSDLERGINRTAHKDTAQLLAGALGLAGPAH